MLRRPGIFVAGACVGAALAHGWRPLVKRTVVAGVVAGSAVKTGATRMAENLTDATHEALSEMQFNGATAGAPASSPMNGGTSKDPVAVTPAS